MAVAYFLAFLLRFDFQEPWWGWQLVASSFVTVWALQSLALTLFGCQRLLWRYISAGDVPRFIGAIGTATSLLILLRYLSHSTLYLGMRPPFSIVLFNSLLVTSGLLGVRLLWRLTVEGSVPLFKAEAKGGRVRRVLLVGAGEAGNLIARELRRQHGRRQVVVGFLDDDPIKHGTRILGYSVLGTIAELPSVVRRYAVEEVIVAMVQVPRNVIRSVVRLCEEAQTPARIVPGYFELIDGSVNVTGVRNIDVADLLGRAESQPDSAAVIELFNGRRVLVTGAGGSIGSELVRQILRTGPELLIMVERSEGALYEIERQVRSFGSSVKVACALADVGDRARMTEIFTRYKPQMVIHAAAHKHVPLMEENGVEALKNNVLGTRVLGEVAVEQGVERFVFISTDKAVKPVSVMGMSKRLAEVVLQDLNRADTTRFCAVRFGNVLGSSGSVVQLFNEQLRKGGPLTVTHPEMQRYFMTIAEAVSLVLQAAALANGGEVFVLDMGEPMRVLELAEEMIVLSGLRPHEDIPIVYTGIRPGEKLFEELDVSERSAYRTGHARIFISKGGAIADQTVANVLNGCRELSTAAPAAELLRTKLHQLTATVAEMASDNATQGECAHVARGEIADNRV